jgi:hypothetical protein
MRAIEAKDLASDLMAIGFMVGFASGIEGST